MFGISLTEIVVIVTIALIVVGPQKLPGMLHTMGQWMRKLRRLTTEVRAQTGIDEILREEGIDGVHELRSLLRGEIRAARQQQRTGAAEDPYQAASTFDTGREYPVEGPDCYGAIPDDLVEDLEQSADAPVSAPAAPPASPPAPAPRASAPPAPPARASAARASAPPAPPARASAPPAPPASAPPARAPTPPAPPTRAPTPRTPGAPPAPPRPAAASPTIPRPTTGKQS